MKSKQLNRDCERIREMTCGNALSDQYRRMAVALETLNDVWGFMYPQVSKVCTEALKRFEEGG